MPRTSKTIRAGSSSRQQDKTSSNRGQGRSSLASSQNRSGSGQDRNYRAASSGQGGVTRGDSRTQSSSREDRSSGSGTSRNENRQVDTGFHNEHYRAGFDAGRAYYHHYDRQSQSDGGDSQRRASDNNLNGPRDDYSRSSGRGRDSDRSAAGDYGETVYRSDNENYGAGQRGDGNLGRSRDDLDDSETDREYSSRSSTLDREADISASRSSRSNRSRGSSRSGKADPSES